MSVFPVTFGAYWFISAYVVMVIVAPYINILLDATSARQLWGAAVPIAMDYLYLAYSESREHMGFTDASYLCSLSHRGFDSSTKIACLAYVGISRWRS